MAPFVFLWSNVLFYFKEKYKHTKCGREEKRREEKRREEKRREEKKKNNKKTQTGICTYYIGIYTYTHKQPTKIK